MEVALIQTHIYEIRGMNVMLDFDLAEIYSVSTKALNQAIKRNLERFPNDFMFKLSSSEWKRMRSQIVTASQRKRNIKALPYAFTEHGVTMLASILRSDVAIQMNIAIVRAFIALRELPFDVRRLNSDMIQLKDKIEEHDIELASLYALIDKMNNEKETERLSWENRERIGFK